MIELKSRDTDYLYISTRLKARSMSLFSRDKLNRLIAAKSDEDASKLLSENGWSAFDPKDLTALEVEIAHQQQEAFELLYRYAPDRRMIDLFRLKYDYHNLKSVIKADALGLDPSALLSYAGTILPGQLLAMARDRDYQKLPRAMRKAAEEAADLLARTGDPQLSDLLLDRTMTAQMREIAEATESDFLLGYVRLMIDLQNLRVLTRAGRAGKGYDYIRRAIFPGGNVTLTGLSGEVNGDLLKSKFASAPLAAPVEAAVVALAGGALAPLDLACDNALIAYLRSSALVPFGEAQVIGYLLAKESELVSVRTVMVSRHAGLSPEQITERLRNSYV